MRLRSTFRLLFMSSVLSPMFQDTGYASLVNECKRPKHDEHVLRCDAGSQPSQDGSCRGWAIKLQANLVQPGALDDPSDRGGVAQSTESINTNS